MISGGGGLVLKASDDVILAVFPHEDPREACEAELNTARDISEGMPAGRLQASEDLHYGEIRYADVGPDRTLHMTAIGSDLQWLQSALRGAGSDDGEPLRSKRFDNLVEAESSLKGFDGVEEVLAAITSP
jgi:hypothetical protein